MINDNNICVKQRIKELIIDYICIIVYLLALLGVSMGFFLGIFREIPNFSELQSQLIATFSSVIPVVIFFSIWDYTNGSIGKRKAWLKLCYKHKSFKASMTRNIVKFLPWQLAHIGVIHGMYTDFDLVAIIFTNTSMGLAIIMLVMGLVRKDKRHLGDLIAGTQVQVR